MGIRECSTVEGDNRGDETMSDKTLFVKVGGDYQWTDQQMDDLIDKLSDCLPDEIGVIVVPDDVEYLTSDELEAFAERIMEAVESD
jgi:hypothetical protein